MKLSEIKTLDQFYEMADVQYQRTIRLADAINDPSKPIEYKQKASLIWHKSMTRVQKLISMYAKMNTETKKFPSGGIVNKSR